ncbi:G-protein coupled receptor 15-like [Hydractinia symbiolongicarpus]|uniref:G-protein coupled receptor 15-like n=1 Tax=Hydractinia symbiolongicarpus TaxID=13093 RepID=UPI00254A1DFE|nr:G-protein coupled receptor 15-like [Hydractinia symbiolongicarpus]
MKLNAIIFTYISPVNAALIIILNILEIVVMFKTNMQRVLSPSLVFILNLSISDIMVGFMIIMVKVFAFLLKTKYKGNKVLLESLHVTKNFMLRLSLLLSVLNLMTFTVVRMLAARKPLFYRKITRRIAINICYCIWLVALVFVTGYYCAMKFTLTVEENNKFETILFPLSTYVVSFGFCYCYWSIYASIREQKRKLAKSDITWTNLSEPSTSNWVKEKKSKQKKNKMLDNERKILRIAVLSVCAFMACWLPLSTFALIKASGALDGWKYALDVEYVFFTLAFVNSILDPFIYMLISHDCKKYIAKLFKREPDTETITITLSSL